MENEKRPVIRFKSFTDDWEKKRAKELFRSTADKGYPELPVLSATQDRGMIRRDENRINVFHDTRNETGYKRVLPGQFVIHLRSFQGGFAHSTIEGITSPAYTVFGFTEPEKHNSEYWKYIFTSKAFIKRLETVTYGIRDGRSISYNEFLNLYFTFPHQKEQSKIARYLDELSALIVMHQSKYNNLQNMKKACLEKMFPRNGSNAPEIRFQGFTDELSCCKAAKIFSSTVDKGHPELPVLSATQDRGMIRRDENSISIFHDKKNETGYKRVMPGQFVIHLRSFQGGFAHSAIEGITSPAYTVFGFMEPEKHDSEYWKYIFTSSVFIKRLETVTYGIRDGRSISYEEFLTLDFSFPGKEEQTQIAQYMNKLNDLIILHKNEIEKLKNIKKSLLEKMFV